MESSLQTGDFSLRHCLPTGLRSIPANGLRGADTEKTELERQLVDCQDRGSAQCQRENTVCNEKDSKCDDNLRECQSGNKTTLQDKTACQGKLSTCSTDLNQCQKDRTAATTKCEADKAAAVTDCQRTRDDCTKEKAALQKRVETEEDKRRQHMIFEGKLHHGSKNGGHPKNESIVVVLPAGLSSNPPPIYFVASSVRMFSAPFSTIAGRLFDTRETNGHSRHTGTMSVDGTKLEVRYVSGDSVDRIYTLERLFKGKSSHMEHTQMFGA